jgi:hypothetical protein
MLPPRAAFKLDYFPSSPLFSSMQNKKKVRNIELSEQNGNIYILSTLKH